MAKTKWQTQARKRWGKQAEWITGDGQFALLAWCRVLTVSLWPTMAEAGEQKKFIDEGGCGGLCSRKHEIVDLSTIPPSH